MYLLTLNQPIKFAVAKSLFSVKTCYIPGHYCNGRGRVRSHGSGNSMEGTGAGCVHRRHTCASSTIYIRHTRASSTIYAVDGGGRASMTT